MLGGGMGALGAPLFSIGTPQHSVRQYDQALIADCRLVTGHGSVTKMDGIKRMIEMSGPMQLDLHAVATNSAQIPA